MFLFFSLDLRDNGVIVVNDLNVLFILLDLRHHLLMLVVFISQEDLEVDHLLGKLGMVERQAVRAEERLPSPGNGVDKAEGLVVVARLGAAEIEVKTFDGYLS